MIGLIGRYSKYTEYYDMSIVKPYTYIYYILILYIKSGLFGS